MKQLTLALALGAALLSSCSQSDLTEVATGKTSVNFSINGQSTITRSATTAGTDGTYTTAFVAKDEIGIFASGASTAANVKYTVDTDGTGLTGENITITKEGEAQFFSYTPYNAEVTTAEKVTHSVAVNQQEDAAYNASNFMTAKSGTITGANPNVAFTFAPRLSLVRVELTGDLGATTSMVKMNAKTDVTWTPSTDAVEATGTTATITLHKETSDATHAIYTGFVPAQTIDGGTKVLEMTVGEKTYAFTPTSNIALTTGAVNKINVKIASPEPPVVTTENIKFSRLSVNAWTSQEIIVKEGEVTEVVPAPIELITAEAGTFTSETALTKATDLKGCVEGWNALITNSANGTITYDETEQAMKLDFTTLGAWYQRSLVYRTPNNAGSLGKYKLTFKLKSANAQDIIVRVMRGQNKEFTSNAYFCTGTNVFGGQPLATATTDYETKTVNIDMSQIRVGTDAVRATTAEDLTTGIAICFSTKTDKTAEIFFIKDVKLIEVK